MTLVLIDTIMMLMDMMICYRKTITGGPGMLFHSELTWVPPGIVQGVPKKSSSCKLTQLGVCRAAWSLQARLVGSD